MDKMKMILALLAAKFPGVRKDGLNMLARLMALQTETEDEAKAAVERLTRDGVDAFVRDFRSDVDKEVSDGTRTFEENLRRKFDLVEKQSEPRADEVKPKADPSPKKREGADAETDLQAVVANAVANAVKPLKEQLERYERGNVNQSRLQALTDRLNACKDESFRAKALKDFGRMTFDTEEAFNEYLTDTETDVADANKRMADAKLAGGPAGPGEFGRVPREITLAAGLNPVFGVIRGSFWASNQFLAQNEGRRGPKSCIWREMTHAADSKLIFSPK